MTDTVLGMTNTELAEKLLSADKEKVFVVVQVAPAVRVMLGEYFGFARGEDVLPKLSFALRAMGADAVVDTAIAQDVVTLAWVKALQNKKYAGGAPVTTGKGSPFAKPADISARMLKKYYGEKEQGKSIRVVAVVCCEKAKGKLTAADVVLTVDELASMIKEAGINLRMLEKVAIDTPFGVASGSAYICAASGGKAEAAARCLIKGEPRAVAQKLAYSGLYGKGAVREAVILADGKEWKFAVVACSEAAEQIRADIENGTCEYDFVEFTCGGCISKGLENCGEKERTLKLRGLGLRYLDKAHAARSAEMSSYAALALKEWEAMVRAGEDCLEYAPITEEELTPAPVEEILEEPVVEEVAEEIPEEPIVEEAVEEIPEEPIVEEAVEEIPEEPIVEEVVEEIPEEPIVEEAVEEILEEPIVEEAVEEIPEEPVVEEVAEEIPEEPIVEEVVEEIPEEPVVEEAVEEIPEEPIVEEVAEEIPEEPIVEEVAEEIPEEPIVEEAAEEIPEEPIVEEVVEEIPEEPVVEEVVEEIPEEPIVEEAVEEIPEEPVVEEVAEEVAFEDLSEEERMKRDPYYRRLSNKERRKLKRKNRK